jgi:hypothetical protein
MKIDSVNHFLFLYNFHFFFIYPIDIWLRFSLINQIKTEISNRGSHFHSTHDTVFIGK